MAYQTVLMADDNDDDSPRARRRAKKEAMKKRLSEIIQRQMMALGLIQGDVVRMVQRHKGRFNRDSMSRYASGVTLPGALQMAALSAVLQFDIKEVDPEADDLLNELGQAPDDMPAFSVTPDVRHPTRMMVRMNMSVSFEDAATLMRVVNDIRSRKDPTIN